MKKRGIYNCDICNKEFDNLQKYKKSVKKFSRGRPIINPKYIKPLIPEKAYILGSLCGDGYLINSNNLVGLEVKDKDFILYFNNCIKKVYGIEGRLRHRNNGIYGCFIISKGVFDDLIKYCKSFKTKQWKVPKEIINSKKKTIKAYFLKGLFDSEGHVEKRQAIIEFNSTNNKAILEVKRLLKELGIDSKLDLKWNRLRIIGIKKSLIFYNNIGFSIKRKQDRLEHIIYSNLIKKNNYEKTMELRKFGLSTTRISKILDINRSLINGWIYEGKIPYIVK